MRYTGYIPTLGDTYDILNWGSITGTFDTIMGLGIIPGYVWDISALYTTGEIIVTVPEPSLELLLGISVVGFIGIGAVRKIRQKAVIQS